MSSADKLFNKRILITGAARGVGAETARILAGRGAKLALVDINVEQLATTAAAQAPGTVCLEADVRDSQQVKSAVEAAVNHCGGLDVVLANAGIIQVEPFAEITQEAFQRTLDVNVFGAWHTLRESLPALGESSGYALVISSLVAAVHLPYMATYDASKAAIEALANAGRAELKIAGSKVDLGVAYFSVINTDFAHDAAKGSEELPLSEISHGPIFKLLEPQRVARAIVRGIERRSRRIVVPWYYGTVPFMPGFAQRFSESYMGFLARRKTKSRKRATDVG